MIKNFDTNRRKDDIKLLFILIFTFVFVVWLCTPPGNKIAQACFYGNNIVRFIAKTTNSPTYSEYKFHRNNAVYHARMNNKKQALRSIDMAVATIPTFASEYEVSNLFKDRAHIRMFFGEYSGALDDYLKVKDIDLTDKFKIAQLYKVKGLKKYALSYCNSIIDTDPAAYSGFTCVADLYAGSGFPKATLRICDMMIDRNPNNAKAYIDRARYKKKFGDNAGYEADIKRAKEITPSINIDSSLIEETLHPKILTLQII